MRTAYITKEMIEQERYPNPAILEFLYESNAIEGVYDKNSLDQAIKAWEYLMSKNILTLNTIQQTHKILMRDQPLKPSEIGHLRKVNVWIGGHMALDSIFVRREIYKWCFEGMRASPPVDSIKLHVEYEAIHPFVDGNGRTGRMFMNWHRIKRAKEPLLIIEETDRQEYYSWFK